MNQDMIYNNIDKLKEIFFNFYQDTQGFWISETSHIRVPLEQKFIQFTIWFDQNKIKEGEVIYVSFVNPQKKDETLSTISLSKNENLKVGNIDFERFEPESFIEIIVHNSSKEILKNESLFSLIQIINPKLIAKNYFYQIFKCQSLILDKSELTAENNIKFESGSAIELKFFPETRYFSFFIWKGESSEECPDKDIQLSLELNGQEIYRKTFYNRICRDYVVIDLKELEGDSYKLKLIKNTNAVCIFHEFKFLSEDEAFLKGKRHFHFYNNQQKTLCDFQIATRKFEPLPSSSMSAIVINGSIKGGTELITNILSTFLDPFDTYPLYVSDFENIALKDNTFKIIPGHLKYNEINVKFLKGKKLIQIVRDPYTQLMSLIDYLQNPYYARNKSHLNLTAEELVPLLLFSNKKKFKNFRIRNIYETTVLSWHQRADIWIKLEDLRDFNNNIESPSTYTFYQSLFNKLGLTLPLDWKERVLTGSSRKYSALGEKSSTKSVQDLSPRLKKLIKYELKEIRDYLEYDDKDF